METISAGEFKTHCLKIMDEVSQKKISYILTKRGKPVAKITPLDALETTVFGFMKDTMTICGDIIQPLEETWSCEK